MIQVIPTADLSRLTRAQLFSLLTQIQAVIADLPTDLTEYWFARGTLQNIKSVLVRTAPTP